MLFGDAKQTIESVYSLSEQRPVTLRPVGRVEDEAARKDEDEADEHTNFPPSSKVIGILRERRSEEKRVSLTPSVVPKLRKMGFQILLEAGAGLGAGFKDEDYVQ